MTRQAPARDGAGACGMGQPQFPGGKRPPCGPLPRVAPPGMVMTLEIDPVPFAVVVPMTLASNMMVTLSLGENPRPFTVAVLPGGPDDG